MFTSRNGERMNKNIDWLPILFAIGFLSVIVLAMLQTFGFTAADLLELARGMREVWR